MLVPTFCVIAVVSTVKPPSPASGPLLTECSYAWTVASLETGGGCAVRLFHAEPHEMACDDEQRFHHNLNGSAPGGLLWKPTRIRAANCARAAGLSESRTRLAPGLAPQDPLASSSRGRLVNETALVKMRHGARGLDGDAD